jgi:hypothetical protein
MKTEKERLKFLKQDQKTFKKAQKEE